MNEAYDATDPAGALCAGMGEEARPARRHSRSPSASSTSTTAPSAAACARARWSRSSAPRPATAAWSPPSKTVADIPGICGIVKGAILPGYYGIEAGQSAVGDIFKWWVEGVCGGDDATARRTHRGGREAQKPGQSGLLALDWNNGNRTILVDQRLTGLLLGQTLHTTRAEIYRALIEATAFGARAIIERIREYGVPIDRVVCSGGIAEKNPLLMQIYADVTGCTMLVAGSSQACALGSAVAAAVLAGAHADFPAAQAAMTSLRSTRLRARPGEPRRLRPALPALPRPA